MKLNFYIDMYILTQGGGGIFGDLLKKMRLNFGL